MVRELKHDGDTGIYVASESEEGTCRQVYQPSAGRTGTHSRTEREICISGTHGAWGIGQTDFMPCLGQKDSFLIPSGCETAEYTLLHGAVSDSRSRSRQG